MYLSDMYFYNCVKAAVHWERPGCALAQSSPNLTLAAMGLRADSARRLSVRAEPLTRWGRAEDARNPIASHVKFGDDCANAQPGLSQWTAAFTLITTSLGVKDKVVHNIGTHSYVFTPVALKRDGRGRGVASYLNENMYIVYLLPWASPPLRTVRMYTVRSANSDSEIWYVQYVLLVG